MKKIIIGALSLLALVACSKNQVIDENRDDKVIEFGVVANSLTRAETVYSNTNMPEAFTVWATFDGKTFIDGDIIKKQADGTWKNITTTRYWPAGCSDTKKVTFYAYVNDCETFKGIEPLMGIASFENFKVNEKVTQQKDMLYATAYASSGPVNLEFKHALYQVAYNAKCTNENLRVVIDGVTICNVADQNSFYVGNASGQEYITWTTYPNVGTAKFPVTFDPVTLDSKNVGKVETLTIPNSNNALLLVPFANQNEGTWNPATEELANTEHAYFLVKCAIANVADDDDEIMLWGAKNQDGTYVTKEIAIPIPGEHLISFASGKQIIYTFVFGQGNGGYNPENNKPVLAPVEWGEIKVNDFQNGIGFPADIIMK